MKKSTRLTLVAVIVLFIIGLYVYPKIKSRFFEKTLPEKNLSAPTPSGQNKAKELPINAVVIAPTALSDQINSTGTLLPEEEVDLSFEASGRITNIYFTEGTFVKKGTLLAKLNDARLLAQLGKLESQLKFSESKAFRQKTLLEKDAISQESYDQIVTEVETNRADIALMKAQIVETELRAPFDGVIGLRLVSEGTYANPTIKVSKLSKISPLKIQFSIPERYVNSVKKGTPITFYLDDLRNYKASVYAVDSKVDEATRTMLVRALYPNAHGELTAGSFANVSIQLSSIARGMAVPSEAIIPEMGKKTVYVYKSGKAMPFEISTGIRTASLVQVTAGLSMGDTLITTGILQMRQGLPVVIENLN